MNNTHTKKLPAAALVLLLLALVGCQAAPSENAPAGSDIAAATATTQVQQAATSTTAPAAQPSDTPEPAAGATETPSTAAAPAATATSDLATSATETTDETATATVTSDETATTTVTSGETPTVAPSATETLSPSPEAVDPTPGATVAAVGKLEVQEYGVPAGSHPHDVAPAADGGVWYTAQAAGKLGWLDPATGEVEEIPLGQGSLPHGVIAGPDGAAWITDGGLNAIVRVDGETREVKRYDLPAERRGANLNTAAFDAAGRLWFTGQNGIYGVLDTATGEMNVYDAPRGRGPYGITATADGKVYYASLAGSYLGQIDPQTGEATVLEPPTAGQGARRAWADSQGIVWVSEWNAGQVARFDPASGAWAEWKLPGDGPRAYAVYVDWQDKVWLSDFGNNSLVRFDPVTEQFESIPLPSPSASVRQIHGRPGEIWGAESSADKLIVVRVQ